MLWKVEIYENGELEQSFEFKDEDRLLKCYAKTN